MNTIPAVQKHTPEPKIHIEIKGEGHCLSGRFPLSMIQPVAAFMHGCFEMTRQERERQTADYQI